LLSLPVILFTAGRPDNIYRMTRPDNVSGEYWITLTVNFRTSQPVLGTVIKASHKKTAIFTSVQNPSKGLPITL
jgi:hypothetical protein